MDISNTVETVGSWVTAGAVASLVTIATTGARERRKLVRAERIRSYAEYLATDSERWAAFAQRYRAKMSGDEASYATADERVKALRDRMYAAYCHAQVAGSEPVVKAMIDCLRVSDARQAAFHASGRRSPGVDDRARALRALVSAARADLKLKSFSEALFAKNEE